MWSGSGPSTIANQQAERSGVLDQMEKKNARGRLLRRRRLDVVRLSTYSSTDSTSRTKRDASFSRNDETTLNSASLKPPMFRMAIDTDDLIQDGGSILACV